MPSVIKNGLQKLSRTELAEIALRPGLTETEQRLLEHLKAVEHDHHFRFNNFKETLLQHTEELVEAVSNGGQV